MVIEGVNTCDAAYQLSKKYDVEMPITTALYKVLFEGLKPQMALELLMGRDKKSEIEELRL